MKRTPFFIACLLFVFFFVNAFSAEENFLVINGLTDEVLIEMGPHIHERMTPACSFNIALSLMGFDSGVLQDEQNPVWDYQPGYDDLLESWKAPHNPLLWMQHSCFWFSKLLAKQLGLETMQHYVKLFSYGNADMSGGVSKAWVSSSLKVSPKEQVEFIQKMLQGKLPVSDYAVQMTKKILVSYDLPDGSKLCGKTGLGSFMESDGSRMEVGWYAGWVEKDGSFLPFAYNIRDEKLIPGQRIARVKQLLTELINTQ